MSTAPPHPSPENTQPPSDEIFHLSPFLTLDHHTISPVYRSAQVPADSAQIPSQQQIPHNSNINPLTSPLNEQCRETLDDTLSEPLDGGTDDPPGHNEIDNARHVVPSPQNSREAYLLLEAARADRRILLARKTLAHQIIHRNVLVLQYNKMVLDRTENDLRAADCFVGHVRLLIRQSGQTAVFEYAMQEDHTLHSSEQLLHRSSIDVDLT